jgi:hypothetical protein
MDLSTDIPEQCEDCQSRKPTTLIITHLAAGGLFRLVTMFYCDWCARRYKQRTEAKAMAQHSNWAAFA